MTANLRLRVPFHHWIPFLSILQQPGMRRNVRSIPITVMESCVPISVEVFHLLVHMNILHLKSLPGTNRQKLGC